MSDSDFNTPPWFLNRVRRLHPRGIGLDPCSNPTSMVKARHSFDIVTNGLMQTWRGNGLVFMNPPHSQSPNNIEPWIQKVIEEFITSPIEREMNHTMDAFLGLVPSKSGPRWFQEIVPQVDGRCFVKGRIRFWQNGVEQEGAGKFDSLVIYIGQAYGHFQREFSDLGWTI